MLSSSLQSGYVPPTLQNNLPKPEFGPMAQMQLPKFNRGLSIASAALGAVSNFAANAPEGTFSNFFGGGGGSPAPKPPGLNLEGISQYMD